MTGDAGMTPLVFLPQQVQKDTLANIISATVCPSAYSVTKLLNGLLFRPNTGELTAVFISVFPLKRDFRVSDHLSALAGGIETPCGSVVEIVSFQKRDRITHQS